MEGILQHNLQNYFILIWYTWIIWDQLRAFIETFRKSIRDNRNYIIVSDVICLGGEVGRARTIIEYCGGKILGEICLVDIKTIKNRDVANRISLYTVSNECNKIGYTIKTDLCDVCREGGTK